MKKLKSFIKTDFGTALAITSCLIGVALAINLGYNMLALFQEQYPRVFGWSIAFIILFILTFICTVNMRKKSN